MFRSTSLKISFCYKPLFEAKDLLGLFDFYFIFNKHFYWKIIDFLNLTEKT